MGWDGWWMSPIPLMICLLSGLAGSNSFVPGQVWQQDGATAHCSQTILNLFRGVKIILWLSGVSWPLHSPDCNLCNSLLWGWVKLLVWRVKPASINDFKKAMEDINATILNKYICATAAPSRSRAWRFWLQMVAILSSFWHPCRHGISQIYMDFYTVSKIKLF